MREILFKAKRKDNNEWVEGQIIVIDSQCFISTYFTDYQCKIISADGSTIYNLEKFCEVIPETVCQYTGLTDKNGVKIFENDIVKATYEENNGYIKWNSNNASFQVKGIPSHTLKRADYLEVIGNIFDKEVIK